MALLPVGVLAESLAIAEGLSRELFIRKPIWLSEKTILNGKLTGQRLGAVLVDQSCWPMDPRVRVAVLASLEHAMGYYYKIERFDPQGEKSPILARRQTPK